MRRVYTVLFLLLSLNVVSAEEVVLRHDGLSLNAQLVLADGRELSDGVILMLHGTLGHNRMEIISTLQSLFAESGKNSLAINLSLDVDNRHGFFPCDNVHTHTQADAGTELGVWLAWLRAEGAGQTVLLGHSRGANQIVRFIIDSSPDVAAAILIAPPGGDAPITAGQAEVMRATEARGWMEHTTFLHCENATVSAESYRSYYGPDNRGDTVALLEQTDLPVLVFAGSEDTVVPDLAAKMAKVNQDNIAFEELDGADHFFRDLYSDDIVESALDFLAGL